MVWLKRGLALLTLGIAIYLFLPLLRDLRAASDLFKTARWIWLPIVIGIQLVSYAFLTWLNAVALQPFQGKIGFFRLAALLTAMAYIEVAIPSAGASGVALRAHLLRKQGGYRVEASTFTLILETIVLAVALGTVALIGVVYLLNTGNISHTHIIFLSLLTLGGIVIITRCWRIISDQQRSRNLLVKLITLWNRILGRFRQLDPTHIEDRLTDFQSHLGHLKDVPRWKFFIAAYGRVALDITTLGTCFLLFGYPITPGTLLTGYGLILIMSGLAALPGGLGLADISVPVIFSRLGTAGEVALVAGLTYRLIAFWMLRFIGFISWQYLEGADLTKAKLDRHIGDHFNARAKRYDNPLTAFIGERELRQIRPLVPVNSIVLDYGCGTGRTTLDLLKRGCIVTAYDISSEMLAIAQKKV